MHKSQNFKQKSQKKSKFQAKKDKKDKILRNKSQKNSKFQAKKSKFLAKK